MQTSVEEAPAQCRAARSRQGLEDARISLRAHALRLEPVAKVASRALSSADQAVRIQETRTKRQLGHRRVASAPVFSQQTRARNVVC
jgi:hypothetical protein